MLGLFPVADTRPFTTCLGADGIRHSDTYAQGDMFLLSYDASLNSISVSKNDAEAFRTCTVPAAAEYRGLILIYKLDSSVAAPLLLLPPPSPPPSAPSPPSPPPAPSPPPQEILSSPLAVGSATDGVNGFTQLKGANGVATFVIGTSTYAIVASALDNGVQLVDVSDPSSPVAVGSATDGVNGFDRLDAAVDVATFVIGTSTYAIVASWSDDGVQLIDVSDPSSPVAVGSATDGVNGFDRLDGARGVTTFVIGTSTYAIVASYYNGVQLIDVSDPSNPVAVGSVTDGVNGFTELDGAYNVATFVIGSSTYAIVASAGDDGVQLVDVTDPSNPVALGSATDGVNGFDELDDPRSVATFVIGTNTYAIVTGLADDGVQLIDVSDPSSPVAMGSATDGVNGFTVLDGAFDVATFVIGTSTYAIVAARSDANDDGVQLLQVGA